MGVEETFSAPCADVAATHDVSAAAGQVADPPSVLVLGDSIAMPRASAGQRLSDAWPQILDDSGAARLRWVRSAGAATSRDVLGEARTIGDYVGDQPTWDVAVVQVGIVDCSPRPLPRRLQKAVEFIPGVRPLINRHLPLLLRLRARPWIDEASFERIVEAIVDTTIRYSGRVLLIEIVRPGPGLLAKLGPFDETVERYNAALRRVVERRATRAGIVRPVSPEEWPAAILPDGHHLTRSGHRAVACAVRRALECHGHD